MKVTLEIESLRCTSGGSDKRYALVRAEVDGKETALIKVHGPTRAPQQCAVGEYSEDEWHRALTSKLKKYNRVAPKQAFDVTCTGDEWLKEGGLFLKNCLRTHGSWKGMGTNDFQGKLDDAARFVVEGVFEAAPDETDVVELFRTPTQREKAKQEKQEAQSLEHWGSF